MTKTMDYPNDFPQKDKKRGRRIYQKLRNKLRAVKQLKETSGNYGIEQTLQWARENADHLAACSCDMCGNQRRFAKGKEKLTVQERKELERTRSLTDKTESSEDSD